MCSRVATLAPQTPMRHSTITVASTAHHTMTIFSPIVTAASFVHSPNRLSSNVWLSQPVKQD